MIHIFIGTKAQLIKIAPIMKELRKRNYPYNFIDTGQHASLTRDLIKEFQLPAPDYYLRAGHRDITTLSSALSWFLSWIWRALFKPGEIFRTAFKGKKGVCLIHGDTLSTLLSLFITKRAGVRVAHVEAGLRSHNLWHPFPEEIIRLITMRFSDILFAPSDWAYQNLVLLGLKGESVNIGGNSSADAVRSLPPSQSSLTPGFPYVVVSIHRFENIYDRSRMIRITAWISRISSNFKVLFLVHKPTENRLRKYRLWKVLEGNPQVELRRLAPYFDYLHLIQNAEFLVTDGGSQQEESFYLNIPCLIMRKKTERPEGLGANAVLSGFDHSVIDDFIENYQQYRSMDSQLDFSPSSRIVDYLAGLEE